HVESGWQRTNGGVSWIDFTANLPDAPANALVVDPGDTPLTGTVYVGTDAGVFSSPTSGANWTEVGPAPASGLPGFLPNVAVTALQMLKTGTDKLLRASTYGRGIWQFSLITTPAFLATVVNPPLTVYAGSPGTFQGTLFSLDGYASPVQLSCTTGTTAPPAMCSPSPASVTPTASGTPFAISAGGVDGAYSFNLHASGTDSNAV